MAIAPQTENIFPAFIAKECASIRAGQNVGHFGLEEKAGVRDSAKKQSRTNKRESLFGKPHATYSDRTPIL